MSLKLTMKMEIFWQEEGTQGKLLLMSISIETNQMLGMIESHNSLGMEIFKDNMAAKRLCKWNRPSRVSTQNVWNLISVISRTGHGKNKTEYGKKKFAFPDYWPIVWKSHMDDRQTQLMGQNISFWAVCLFYGQIFLSYYLKWFSQFLVTVKTMILCWCM